MKDDGRNDLAALLSEPVLDETPKSGLWPLTAALLVVAAIVGGYFVFRDGNPPATADSTDTSVPSGSATVVSSPVATEATEGSESTAESVLNQYPSQVISARMALDPDSGTVVMFGGKEGPRGQGLDDTWLYDVTEDQWHLLDATTVPPRRLGHAMTYVDSLGEVVVVGGGADPVSACSLRSLVRDTTVDVWSLNVASGSWTWLTQSFTPDDRWGHAIAYDSESDRLMLFGGVGAFVSRDRAELLSDTWVYDVSSNTWEPVETDLTPDKRACHQMVYDPSTGLVYLWGGQTEDSAGDGTMWTFDLSEHLWSEVDTSGAAAPEPRWSHQMVFEPNSGMIFMIGGAWFQTTATDTGTVTALGPTDEVWAFDPSTARWQQRAPAPGPLWAPSAAPTGDGRILIFSAGATAVYDPASDSWEDLTPTASSDPTP